MDAITRLFRDSVEFANPEYLAIVPIAGLLLAFGLVVFALRLQLRPARTEGSNYPFFGHIKFWFFAIAALALVAVAAARPFWVYGASSFKRGDVDVIVAVDASASMWVKDLGPSRLELAVRSGADPALHVRSASCVDAVLCGMVLITVHPGVMKCGQTVKWMTNAWRNACIWSVMMTS